MKLREEIITSRNNTLVKWAASLADKKGRSAERHFIAEGEKLTREAIDASLPITHIFVSESRGKNFAGEISELLKADIYENTEIIMLGEGAFEKISTEKAPQGVISVIKYLDFLRNMDIIYNVEKFLGEGERALALCGVRDPGNLGAVIRSAAAFGVDHIILSADSADIYNPKTVRAAMGSLFRTSITVVSDFCGFVRSARESGRRVYAAELTERARALSEVGLAATDVMVIGNEGHGIPPEVSSVCDGSVYIPISKKTESLNASVAAAIFMWEQNK